MIEPQIGSAGSRREAPVAFGSFVLDRRQGTLHRQGVEIALPERSLRLLEVLVAAAGETLSKDRLIAEVWQGAFVSDTSLTEAMSRLRRALGTEAREQRYIRTVHGRGYRFVEPVTVTPGPGASALSARAASGRSGPRRLSIAVSAVLLGVVAILAALGALAGGWRWPPPAETAAAKVGPRYRLAEVSLDGSRVVEYGVPSLPLNGFSVDHAGRVVFSMSDGPRSDAWVYEPERDELRRFATGGRYMDPVWRPGGNQGGSHGGNHGSNHGGDRSGSTVALAKERDGDFDLVLKEVDREGPAEVLLDADLDQFPESWSADGRALVYSQHHPETGYDLWILRQQGTGWQPTPLVRTPDDEAFGAISPDGRYVAFTSRVGRLPQILVIDLERDLPPVRVSAQKGAYPFWSANGHLLHYVSGDELLSVPVARLTDGRNRDHHPATRVAGLYLAGAVPTADRIVVAMRDPAIPSLH